MVSLPKIFHKISPFNALVVGDLMIDAYTFGKAQRISPEAPVPVIHVQSEESRPGGAGNVALNLVSMGAKVSVMGRVGYDPQGAELCALFENEGIHTNGVYSEENYITPKKNRIIANAQQILRIDHEIIDPLSLELEDRIIHSLPSFLQNIHVIAISDYGKGFLSDRLLHALIEEAAKREIPVIVDPKGLNFEKYQGATWLKPNCSEAYQAAKMPLSTPLETVAKELIRLTNVQWLMITRSEAGISLFNRNLERFDFPVVAKEIKDVTGAGDTVLAMLTTAIASGLSSSEAALLSNIAAGIAIERIGCARVTIKEVAQHLLNSKAIEKIYHDDRNLNVLEDLLRYSGYQLLNVPSSSGLTSAVFREIRRIRNEDPIPLLVHVQDSKQDDEMVNILADLYEVDFVISRKESLEVLMKKTPPSKVHTLL